MTIHITAQTRAKQKIQALNLGSEYPFAHSFINTPMGAMHYVDEGGGDPVLMMHGNPTWSFLYRKFISGLSSTHRMIAPDHIGFGLSDKPYDVSLYTIEAHIRNIETLILELDLRNITLVIQDWGGPVGLGAAARHPERFKALIVLNSFGFYPLSEKDDPENLKLPAPLVMMRSNFPGTFLVTKMGMFERMAMPTAVANAKAFKSVKPAYTDIFEGAKDRAGVLAFPRLIPTRSQDPAAQILLNETAPFLKAFKGPVRIFWGMKDQFFPVEALRTWQRYFPRAQTTELATGRHYIQEDAPDIIVPEIREFLNQEQ